MAENQQPSKRVQERRAGFQRYKRDVEKRGKPFYPFAMFHDTVMSLVVVSVIVVLAVIWKFTAGEHANDSGWLGTLYKEKADPGTTSFVPRPDWYFYFLFYLLRIFKWPESVILGAVAKEPLAGENVAAVPGWIAREHLPSQARPGAELFAKLTCLGCHTYLGSGSSNLGAPDLTSIGSKNLGVDFQIRHLKCPSCVTPGSPMPPFAQLGEDNLRKLA